MAQGNSVRLWDTSRSMLLRTWKTGSAIKGKESISLLRLCLHFFVEITPDASRPDRAWFFGVDGSWGLLNGMVGKIDRQGNLPAVADLISCGRDAFVILAGERLIGYNYNFEGIFEVSMEGREECSVIAMHPTRADLIATCSRTHLQIIKISSDNWAPQWTTLPLSHVTSSLQWGPEETDPISQEPLCKLVAVGSESRSITLYSIKEEQP